MKRDVENKLLEIDRDGKICIKIYVITIYQ